VEFTVPIAAIQKDVEKNKAHCEPDFLNSDLVREEHCCYFSKLAMTSVLTRRTLKALS